MRPTCFLLLFLALGLSSLMAQQPDPRDAGVAQVFPFGRVETIESEALGEVRTLNIYLPQGYHPDSARRYPVIYVLDGSAHEDFPHIAGLAQFMNMYGLLPPSIVVGIANVDRYRDFTYPSQDTIDQREMPSSGGSERFIRFMDTEALPYIDQHFPTTGQRTLIGQSMGGLLATEVLFRKPALFQDYIIVSPSLWWDEQRMVRKADEYLRGRENSKTRVYLCLGQEHPVMHQVADLLADALRKAKITVFYQPILTEDHATILHLAVYQAFKALYPLKEKE